MTKTFGRRVLVDFVNRWCALQQPAGRATIKGIFQSQLFSTIPKIRHFKNQGHINLRRCIAPKKVKRTFYRNSVDPRGNKNRFKILFRCYISFFRHANAQKSRLTDKLLSSSAKLLASPGSTLEFHSLHSIFHSGDGSCSFQ